MKIHDMTQKTAIEVENTDLLVIEDEEDTKAITAATLKELIILSSDRHMKELINETIDKIMIGMAAAKYVFSTLIEKKYRLNIWIGSASGNIQIAIMDVETAKWLTSEEINELFWPTDENGNIIPVEPKYDEDGNELEPDPIVALMMGGILYSPDDLKVLNFNEEHGKHPEEVNPWLAADDAGFIKAHFDGFTQNEISGILYEDIHMQKSDDYDEETDTRTTYEFITARSSFSNAVHYTVQIPTCCCKINAEVPGVGTTPGRPQEPGTENPEEPENPEEDPEGTVVINPEPENPEEPDDEQEDEEE